LRTNAVHALKQHVQQGAVLRALHRDCCLQGHPKVAATFARVSGYVEQTDIHSPQVPSPESAAFYGRPYVLLTTTPSDYCGRHAFAHVPQ